MRAELPGWARKLLGAGANPRDALLDEIAALGEAARPALLSIVRGEVTARPPRADEDASPRGYAIELLGRLPHDEAGIAACIGVLATRCDSHSVNAAEAALAEWGTAATTALLDAIPRSSPEVQCALATVLATFHGPDDRILALLLDRLRADLANASDVAQYGDPAALPEIQRLFDAYVVDGPPTIYDHMGVFELEGAILRLGGELTLGQTDKVARAHRRFRRAMRDAGLDPDKNGDAIELVRKGNRTLAEFERKRREGARATAAAPPTPAS
jgi:hypothetical protein